MSNINVQFSDGTGATIVCYFGSPQDSAVYPNLGTVDSADLRWKSYLDAQPADIRPFLPVPD